MKILTFIQLYHICDVLVDLNLETWKCFKIIHTTNAIEILILACTIEKKNVRWWTKGAWWDATPQWIDVKLIKPMLYDRIADRLALTAINTELPQHNSLVDWHTDRNLMEHTTKKWSEATRTSPSWTFQANNRSSWHDFEKCTHPWNYILWLLHLILK